MDVRPHSDDLQSAVFVLLDLLLGRLPWFDEARAKDKARVLELKQQVSQGSKARGRAVLGRSVVNAGLV